MEIPKKSIIVLSRCDEWKCTDSMRLCCLTTSSRRMRTVISQLIKDGDMDYLSGEPVSRTKQVQDFRRDWDEGNLRVVNGFLKYGYVDVVNDGDVN